MSDEELSTMLSADFDAAAAAYEQDGFHKMLRARLESHRRIRAGVLGVAALAGAALASAQFGDLLKFVSASTLASGHGFNTPVLTASLVIASAAIATAVVLRRES